MFKKPKTYHFFTVHPVCGILLGAMLTAGLATLCLCKHRAIGTMLGQMMGRRQAPCCDCPPGCDGEGG